MIYLDHHAASPLLPSVEQAMSMATRDGWANPSSRHRFGQRTKQYVETARQYLSDAIGAKPSEIIFTSGGTEACNLAILGHLERANAIVTTAIEHPAIDACVTAAESRGVSVHRLGITELFDPNRSADTLEKILNPSTMLVMQWVNHETGHVLDIDRFTKIAQQMGAFFIVDGSQALGKLRINVREVMADAIAFGAQKIGGPSGVGALFVRGRDAINPTMLGGAQERGQRAGTPNTIGIVGFGEACRHLDDSLHAQNATAAKRDRLRDTLIELGALDNSRIEGFPSLSVVAGCCNLSFPTWKGSELVAALDIEGVMVSSGPACSSGLDMPSPTVLALHGDEKRARSAVRLSLGMETADDEIARAIATFSRVLHRQT
ncbi:MAG: cysteine desulfurase family protein [Polyangiales bacterium]